MAANLAFVADPTGAHTTNATLSSAQTLTRPTGADVLYLQAFAQAVRYTLDGTTPTASTGFRLAANEFRVIEVGEATAVKVIEETGSASIQYQWMVLVSAQR